MMGTGAIRFDAKRSTSATALKPKLPLVFLLDGETQRTKRLDGGGEAAVHLYRIAQEAIHNSVMHGKATKIVVSLRRQDDSIILCVTDNGCGLASVSSNGSRMGFENMNYRAGTIGARLDFAPRNKGGTVVNCTLPSHTGAS